MSKKRQAMLKAIRDLCPKASGEVTGVTIECNGQSVTLTAATRARINRQLKEGFTDDDLFAAAEAKRKGVKP